MRQAPTQGGSGAFFLAAQDLSCSLLPWINNTRQVLPLHYAMQRGYVEPRISWHN
uniref:Uncharacterized protein n=1 Tax=Arundo donax TaxID=35708 RepID=A0A0A9BIG2_ARUDO